MRDAESRCCDLRPKADMGWSWRMLGLLAVMVLSACSGGRIDVTRTAALPDDVPKATFIMVRGKTQDHAKEWPKFADQIAGQLAARNLSRVEAASQARYAVMFSYDGDGMGGKSEGSARKHRDKDKKSGGGPVEREVSIALFDLSRPNQPNEKVFGGRALCKTEAADANAVVAAMIDAVLKDFPGKDRETYGVSLPGGIE